MELTGAPIRIILRYSPASLATSASGTILERIALALNQIMAIGKVIVQRK